jgi:hypothetical protein
MTLTVDFTSNQQSIVAASTLTNVRFWDKSVTTNGVITSWIWIAYPRYTVTFPGSPDIAMTDASTYFVVDDRIVFTTSGALPTGISPYVAYWVVQVTATTIRVSTSQGGAATTYSGAASGSCVGGPGSDQQNPIIPYRNVPAGSYMVTLGCNDSGGTGVTYKNAAGYMNAVAYTFSKPANAGLFGRITIFVYDSANATAINRVKTTNNNLFFQSLKCTSSITKAGNATFTVYTTGTATATEIGLMAADKNVAIISGRDVIWSGKISRAVQGKLSLFDAANPFQSWDVECESDIAKMRYQNVKAANQIAYNAPPGYIISKLVEPSAATDIDWRGAVTPSLISYEGANIQYTITSADMQSQFLTLADLTGYDWRTRNDWVKYAYGASGYDSTAKTVTVAAIAPYTTNSFAGKWLLFVNDVNADTTANNIGIKAYGLVASNTTTVITMSSITNATLAPASSNNVIILGNPVLDFSSDFRQPTYVSTFTMNKARASTLQNGYEMNDMSDFKQVITKFVAKGKLAFVPVLFPGSTLSVVGSTATMAIAAKDEFDTVKGYPKNSAFITFPKSGYIYQYTDGSTSLVVIGQGFAIKSGDELSLNLKTPVGIANANTSVTGSPTTQTQLDGTLTTTIPIAAVTVGATIAKYSTFFGNKIYVNDNSIYTSGTIQINVGGIVNAMYINSSGVDATYGPYLSAPSGTSQALALPVVPGTIISLNTYTESAPQTGSPVNYFGLIEKTVTVDSATTVEQLALYATNYLLNHSFYYRKGTFWAFVYDWFKPDIRAVNEVSENGWLKAGDEICILQNTGDSATDLQYGQYKNQWQVVAWTLDADSMVVSADLGDHERNTNTLINDKTAGINYTIT